MSLILHQFEIGPMQNFGYLIGDSKTKEAFVVDPAWSPQRIQNEAQSKDLTIKGMIITHAHYDHTNAVEDLLDLIDVPVYAHADEIMYSKSGVSIVGSLGRTAKPLQGGDKIKCGETELEFLHTPGHTPGSQCVRVGSYLITGDTLFVGGCGRSDLPGGDPATLFKSLQKIASLPPDLEICPGHDYGEARSRKLKDEKFENPYLQMKSENDFLSAVS